MSSSLVQKQFGAAAADYAASAVHASGPSLGRLVALVVTAARLARARRGDRRRAHGARLRAARRARRRLRHHR